MITSDLCIPDPDPRLHYPILHQAVAALNKSSQLDGQRSPYKV